MTLLIFSVTFYPDMQTDFTVFSLPEEDFFGDIDDVLNSEDNQSSLPSPFGSSLPYIGPVLPPEMMPDSRIRFTELTSAGDEPIYEPSQDAEPEPTLNATDNGTDTNHPDSNATTETNKRRYFLNSCAADSSTRRVIRPVTQGNNRYGRRGQRRCHQCRKWKQKVTSYCYSIESSVNTKVLSFRASCAKNVVSNAAQHRKSKDLRR
jgi:hypothetical protein